MKCTLCRRDLPQGLGVNAFFCSGPCPCSTEALALVLNVSNSLDLDSKRAALRALRVRGPWSVVTNTASHYCKHRPCSVLDINRHRFGEA